MQMTAAGLMMSYYQPSQAAISWSWSELYNLAKKEVYILHHSSGPAPAANMRSS